MMENPIKMDDLWVSLFLETPIYWKQGQPQKYVKEMMRFPQFSHKEGTCRFFGHEQFAAMVAKGEGIRSRNLT